MDIRSNSARTRFLRRSGGPLLAMGLLIGAGAAPAAATSAGKVAPAPASSVIVLPGATSAEGIAAGAGSTFYAGDLFGGDIFRGDIRQGSAELFIDAPAGRRAFGMKADVRQELLFVAGGPTGQAYVYNTRTGASVAEYQLGTGGALGAPGVSVINDVALVRGGAWFTDSGNAKLYFIPVSKNGTLGPARTLELTGPAAEITGAFNLNGIQGTPDGGTLIVSHSTNQRVYTVDPKTGASAVIEGITVPNADGIVLRGRTLWVNQNVNNTIARFKLSAKLDQGTLEKEITSPDFGVPTTSALFGNQIATVNAHFNTGFPPTSPTYEVVVVRS